LPQPPLLVPELMGSSTVGSRDLRAACLAAVTRLRAISKDWCVVASGARSGNYGSELCGSLADYGADVAVSLRAATAAAPVSSQGAAQAEPPLPVLLAGGLRAGAAAEWVRVELVAADDGLAGCAAAASRLARTASETGLLVLGDGSNRRGARAPGGNDDRAADFYESVAGALATADVHTLRD